MSIYHKLDELQKLPFITKSDTLYQTRLFRCKHKSSGKNAILKQHRFIDDPDYIREHRLQNQLNALIKQFMMEPEALLKTQNCPFIMKMLDYEQDLIEGKSIYLVLKEAQGVTLTQHIEKQGPLILEALIEVCLSLIEAVQFLHRAGYIHRDLTPANVMVDIKDNTLKSFTLIDLGLVYNKVTGLKFMKANTGYFAPPESVGSMLKPIYPSYDLYSVGALIHYVVTAQTPYPMALLNSEEEESSYGGIQRNDIPESMKYFVKKCLSYDPIKRPQNLSQLYKICKNLSTIK